MGVLFVRLPKAMGWSAYWNRLPSPHHGRGLAGSAPGGLGSGDPGSLWALAEARIP